MGIKTTYTANLYDYGIVKGSIVKRVWFWVSPVWVHRQMEIDLEARDLDYAPANFRKV